MMLFNMGRTQGQSLKCSKTSLNSVCSFSYTGCLTKANNKPQSAFYHVSVD